MRKNNNPGPLEPVSPQEQLNDYWLSGSGIEKEKKLMNEKKLFKGTVKFFKEKKGYGFIEPENKKDDLFFHVSNVEGDNYLEQNDEVEFEIEKGLKGPKAVRVRKID